MSNAATDCYWQFSGARLHKLQASPLRISSFGYPSEEKVAEYRDPFGGTKLLRIDEIGFRLRDGEFGQKPYERGGLAGHEIGDGGNAETAFGGAQNGIDVIDGEDRLAFIAGPRARLEEPIDIPDRGPRIPAIDDEAMFIEIFELLRRAVFLEIVGGGIDQDPHRQEMALDEIGLTRRRHADRDIGLAHGKIELAVIDDEAHLDLGVKLEKFPDTGGEPGRAEGDRGRHLERTLGAIL